MSDEREVNQRIQLKEGMKKRKDLSGVTKRWGEKTRAHNIPEHPEVINKRKTPAKKENQCQKREKKRPLHPPNFPVGEIGRSESKLNMSATTQTRATKRRI